MFEIMALVLLSQQPFVPVTEGVASFYTTKEQGLGLGLSICRSIIGAHSGRLWAESHGSGNGSSSGEKAESGATFHMELPSAP